MRTARKCGATSETMTGPAPKRLGCLRTAASRQQSKRPPVDGGEAEGDQRQSPEILRREGLAEEQSSEQYRDRGDEQGDQQRVGRAGMVDQSEIEDVAER